MYIYVISVLLWPLSLGAHVFVEKSSGGEGCPKSNLASLYCTYLQKMMLLPQLPQ
jgi:hypothetical protein